MTNNLIQLLSAIAQVAAVVGIYLLYRQVELNRKTTQVQLINELEKEFANHNAIFAKIKPGGPWHGLTDLSFEEVAQLENLASFCEKLKHFLDCHILNWKTLDLMFRNRFFLIMHNANIFNLVIEPCLADWEAAIILENEWRKRLPKSDPRRKTIYDIAYSATIKGNIPDL
ncbi:MAG: hypothetical protein V2B20_13820 [Pseudomonadota bacterium]